MYRVLIVDDEPIIRSGLTHFIDWKQHGCEIVGQAGDGLMAKEQVALLHPDIVITDIRMSGLDGLELTEFLYVHYPYVKIIMLTGYADFSYAQSAIRFGVVDFLLKPTTNEQVIQAIGKAAELLDRERQAKGQFTLIQEKFFQDMIYGILTDLPTILGKGKEYKIDISSFSLVLFEINPLKDEGNRLPLKTIENIIKTSFQPYDGYSFPIGREKVGVVISAEREQTAGICLELIQSAESLFSLRMRAGISDRHHVLTEIHSAYQEALSAMALGSEEDNDVAIFRSDMIDQEESYQRSALVFCERIVALLEEDQLEVALQEIYSCFEIKKIFQRSVEKYKLVAIKLYLELWNHSQPSVNVIHDKIIMCDTVPQVAEALTEYIRKTVSATRIQDGNALISKSLEFIQNNYHQELSLQSIADAVYLNSSYLSKLFHKETGETVTEAITKIRMKKAMDLLTESEIKTHEIASKVGFDNPAYFSHIFKKRFGLTPKEYRASKR
ncbi:response regulator [Cohnella luojiensis]|uniref:Response regulator n=1 Tax=Cohnella luojiensis TaxID=652876 RepID=A0A4Y8LR30_9BACL|nr:response regulator [Cohnella luojiensis]TFE23328.1 response regulator [Cohnella luojiensis]